MKEAPHENRYADFAGEEQAGSPRRSASGRGGERRERGPRALRGRRRSASRATVNAAGDDRRPPRKPAPRPEEPAAPMPAVDVRFVPDARVLESVLAQIKGGHLAYSVFSLARMFLEKPERYDVRLKAETARSSNWATTARSRATGAFSRTALS